DDVSTVYETAIGLALIPGKRVSRSNRRAAVLGTSGNSAAYGSKTFDPITATLESPSALVTSERSWTMDTEPVLIGPTTYEPSVAGFNVTVSVRTLVPSPIKGRTIMPVLKRPAGIVTEPDRAW